MRIAFGSTSSGAFTLDPATSKRLYESLSALYGYLVTYGPKYDLVGDLATSWTPNADATQWTFKLREGVRFHNGKPFTADDVVYTIQRVLDPAVGSSALSLLKPVLDRDGVKALDDHTVVFQLKAPNSTFPGIFTAQQLAIIPAGSGDTIAKTGIGTGPFKLRDFPPGGTVVVERNDDYWRGKPKLDTISFVPIPDSAARINAQLAGEVDLLYSDSIGATDAKRLSQSPSIFVYSAPSGYWDSLVMNTTMKPFDDVRVRQAFKAVVDEEKMLATALQGNGSTASNNPVGPLDGARVASPHVRDVEKAKKLLRDAGYPNGIDVTLDTSSYNANYTPLALSFQQQAAEAGIRVEIKQHPADGYSAFAESKSPFYMEYWGPRQADILMNTIFRTGAGSNYSRWSSPEFDSLLDQIRATTDETKRKELYARAQELLASESGNIIPVFENVVRAGASTVRGFPGTNPEARPDYFTLGFAAK